MAERSGGARVRGGREYCDRGGGDEGLDREGPRRETGRGCRAGGRRQGRRTARYGGGGRQGRRCIGCGAGGRLQGRREQAVTESVDVLVVGAGPTGLACGIELQNRGMKTVLVEKGCVVNSLYNYPTNMTFFTTPELLEIGNIPMTSLNDKPNRTEALKYYRKVADHFKLDVRQYERVDRIAGEDNAFEVFTTDKLGCNNLYRTRKIVLATGYYDVPNMLNVPGEELD